MKERKIPMRKCVGCMVSKEKQELIRIACFEGQLSVDLTGRAKGRGVYLCKGNHECLEKAYKRKALERAFSLNLPAEEKDAFFLQIEKGISCLEEGSDE